MTGIEAAPDLGYERKYLKPGPTHHALEGLIRVHPGLFREIYAERWVNNLYFDSPDLDCFHDNHLGAHERFKLRVRWYGEPEGEIQPQLELKLKRGPCREKRTHALEAVTLAGPQLVPGLLAQVRKSEVSGAIRLRLGGVVPLLVNRYRRRYYRSVDGRYRITLDWDGSYRAVSLTSRLGPERRAPPQTILELKYGVAEDAGAARVMAHFPLRQTKSSKFVQGLIQLGCVAPA